MLKSLLPFLLFSITLIALCQTQTEVINNELNSECKIPNQSKTLGICTKRNDCLQYLELFNVDGLDIERLSFIVNLNCGFDYETWTSLVCCPKPENTYKYVKSLTFVIHFSLKCR